MLLISPNLEFPRRSDNIFKPMTAASAAKIAYGARINEMEQDIATIARLIYEAANRGLNFIVREIVMKDVLDYYKTLGYIVSLDSNGDWRIEW